MTDRAPRLAFPQPDEPEPQAIQRLAGLLAAHAPHDGLFQLRLPGVHAIRRSTATREPIRVTYDPAVCIVAQGGKTAMLGREVFEYHPGRMLVSSVDIPMVSQISQASEARPFLCLKLDLDPFQVTGLAQKVFPLGVPGDQKARGVYVGQTTKGIIDAATRLLELLSQPADAQLLAPLVVDEILIRLLRSPVGGRVAQIGQAQSSVRRIAMAVSWIRANYSQPMMVEALAELVHMSVSSFHQHFKAVTSMSPLQYQKVLRLQEARRLVLSQTMDASSASRHVGYASASQFSREYARYFGCSPMKDVTKFREEAASPPPERVARRRR